MPISFVNHSDGTVMSWTDIASNWTSARSWLHAIPNADLAASAVVREHLVRPVISGFPIEGFESSFVGAYSAKQGIPSPDIIARQEFGSEPTRLTIIPHVNDSLSRRWYLPIGKTFRTPQEESELLVSCSFGLQTRNNYAGPYYPDGAGGPTSGVEDIGFFQLVLFTRSLGIEAPIGHSVRPVWPVMIPTGGSPAGTNFPWNDHVQLHGAATLGADQEFDLMVVYDQSNAGTSAHQLDLVRIQLVAELLGEDP